MSELFICHPERESRDLGDGWQKARHSYRPSAQVPRLTLGMTDGDGQARAGHASLPLR
jgi:hypothetical protein